MKRFLLRVALVLGAVAVAAALGVLYARFVEPAWLCVKRVRLAPSPALRVIHITDIHFGGDTRYLNSVVATVNALDADCVCFTGDLVEEAAFVDGALEALSRINKPLYGIPGNHDQWVARRSFHRIRDTFLGTGGDWLCDGSNAAVSPSKRLVITTLAAAGQPTPPGYRRILLEHYPDVVARLRNVRFDLILSGHTHGGQVRVPFIHRRLLPFELGIFDRGLFQTPSGPLYVNPGIGTYYLNVRFLCRPELTVIEI